MRFLERFVRHDSRWVTRRLHWAIIILVINLGLVLIEIIIGTLWLAGKADRRIAPQFFFNLLVPILSLLAASYLLYLTIVARCGPTTMAITSSTFFLFWIIQLNVWWACVSAYGEAKWCPTAGMDETWIGLMRDFVGIAPACAWAANLVVAAVGRERKPEGMEVRTRKGEEDGVSLVGGEEKV